MWDETVFQTGQHSQAWSIHGSRDLHMNVNSLTLGVISLAGFGRRIECTDSTVDSKEYVPPVQYESTNLREIIAIWHSSLVF